MNVPLLDLKRQHATIRDEIGEVIREVVESQVFIKGPKVVELEARVAEYSGSKRAVGVASGTDALLLSLMAYGVGRGDEVITVSQSSVATVAALVLRGESAVLVDVEPRWRTIVPAGFTNAAALAA